MVGEIFDDYLHSLHHVLDRKRLLMATGNPDEQALDEGKLRGQESILPGRFEHRFRLEESGAERDDSTNYHIDQQVLEQVGMLQNEGVVEALVSRSVRCILIF